jgi:membrane protein YqaA with SNARE-associated domain
LIGRWSVASTEKESRVTKGARRWEYYVGILGVVLTIAMAVAVVYFWDFVQRLEGYGYAGAFFISILGGAIIIIPVPMLAVVFALGGVLSPYWVGVAAGMGETVGALTIYMTGYGGGTALLNSKHGKVQAAYERLMGLMERRGSWVLFLLSAILNPFFYPAALTAGALRFGIRRYFIICAIGKTIKGMTVAYAGFYGLRGLLRMLGMPV